MRRVIVLAMVVCACASTPAAGLGKVHAIWRILCDDGDVALGAAEVITRDATRAADASSGASADASATEASVQALGDGSAE